ncbi:hypothetical protein GC197_18365 [bacterium]|nr:hypothetical protein [bacterium]
MSVVVCDPTIAWNLDSENHIDLFLSDGTPCKLRQRGFSEMKSNLMDVLSDSHVMCSLTRAIQNSTECEIQLPATDIYGRFVSDKRKFEEHSQDTHLNMKTTMVGKFPTFNRTLEEIRSFEELLNSLNPVSTRNSVKRPKLSEALLAKSSGLQIWPDLTIPISFRNENSLVYGIVEIRDVRCKRVIVRWIDGPERVNEGTELLLWSLNSELPMVLGTTK